MKNIFITAVLLLSSAAHADYFFCRITMGNHSAEYEADYRVFESSVSMSDYTCAGKMESGGVVTACLIVNSSGAKNCTYDRLHAVIRCAIPVDSQMDHVTCECGLQ